LKVVALNPNNHHDSDIDGVVMEELLTERAQELQHTTILPIVGKK
jgi:hypothetical protein